MTIDLTGLVPALLQTCDHCARDEDLFRLVGTYAALCQGCFADKHS